MEGVLATRDAHPHGVDIWHQFFIPTDHRWQFLLRTNVSEILITMCFRCNLENLIFIRPFAAISILTVYLQTFSIFRSIFARRTANCDFTSFETAPFAYVPVWTHVCLAVILAAIPATQLISIGQLSTPHQTALPTACKFHPLPPVWLVPVDLHRSSD